MTTALNPDWKVGPCDLDNDHAAEAACGNCGRCPCEVDVYVGDVQWGAVCTDCYKQREEERAGHAMTMKTPYDHPLDNPLLTRDERLEGQAAYRRGYADAQARAEKLAKALRRISGFATPLLGPSDEARIAEAALQEWDAQKGNAS